MKKVFVILLILAVAGGLFAQEGVTFSGAVKTGVNFHRDGWENMHVKPYNDDAGVPTRVDLGVEAVKDNFGLKFKIRNDFDFFVTGIDQWDGSNTPVPTLSASFKLPYAYAWANILNDVIKVNAGILDDSPWATAGDYDDSLGNVAGTRVEIKPFEALNIGVALDATNGLAGGLSFIDFLKETTFGAKFTIDPLEVMVAFKLDSDTDGPSNDWNAVTETWKAPKDDTDGDGLLMYSINVTAIDALTLVLDGDVGGLTGGDVSFNWHQKVGFQISEPLGVFLTVVEIGAFDDFSAGSFDIKPKVTYQINEPFGISLGLEFNTFFDFATTGIHITPGFSYAFGETAKIASFYKVGIPLTGGGDSTHDIQLDFIWTF